jgi:acyl-CoA synthetase (AMP-forming)/AMP-acid ligase II
MEMIQNQYEKYCLPQLKIYEQETFLVDHQGFRLTYEGLKEKIDARACELEKELAPGAIAILGKNTWNFYAAVLSCLKLNRPVFIFNSEWQKEQIQGNLEVLNISNLLRIESANQESVEICKRDMPLPNYQSGIYLATSGTTSQSKWVYQDLHAVFTNLRGLAQTVGFLYILLME